MAKRIDPTKVPSHIGSGYPPPYDVEPAKRERKRLAEAAGLTKIGVSLLRLPPGTWSTQRHWHINADEFVYVLSGEITLVTDDGEEVLRPGDSAGFKANDRNGHHLQNRSASDAFVLEIGNHLSTDTSTYPDIDLVVSTIEGHTTIKHKDGTPY